MPRFSNFAATSADLKFCIAKEKWSTAGPFSFAASICEKQFAFKEAG
jgi:hypothetical protein